VSGANRVNYPVFRLKGGIKLGFLRWLGGIVVFFWVAGFLFRFAGRFFNLLLIVAAIVYLYDFFFVRKRYR
jgi:hypothetical protein